MKGKEEKEEEGGRLNMWGRASASRGHGSAVSLHISISAFILFQCIFFHFILKTSVQQEAVACADTAKCSQTGLKGESGLARVRFTYL